MLTIDRTLNAIWRVRKARPLPQRVLVYWAALTLGPLLLGVSLSLSSYALSSSRGFVGQMPFSVNVLLNSLEYLLLALAMSGLYHYVPNTHVQWRHALAGGFFVATGLELAKKGLALYLGNVPTYATLYGAFAAVPILLIWIYLAWVIVLLGAVIAAYAPSLQMRVVRRPVVPGYRFHLVVSLLRELAAARTSGRRGLSASELSTRLRSDPLQTDPLLDMLVEIDWVGRLEEDGAARYVLLCDPETTPAQPMLERALLDHSPSIDAFWRKASFDHLTLRDLIAS
jgi:membrane protein